MCYQVLGPTGIKRNYFTDPILKEKKNNRDYVLNIDCVTEIKDACYELLHLSLMQPCEIRLAIPI